MLSPGGRIEALERHSLLSKHCRGNGNCDLDLFFSMCFGIKVEHGKHDQHEEK